MDCRASLAVTDIDCNVSLSVTEVRVEWPNSINLRKSTSLGVI